MISVLAVTRWRSLIMRLCDITLSAFGILIAGPVCFAVYLALLAESPRPLFVQRRVGRHQQPFRMLKFRTMRMGTTSAPTHLVDAGSVTPLGRILRTYKIDELPQLWNVFCGDMSFVGPRPCLPSQEELIRQREVRGVFAARPGITGLAQVQGIDMSTPQLLADVDADMIASLTIAGYLKLIAATVSGRGRGDKVRVIHK